MRARAQKKTALARGRTLTLFSSPSPTHTHARLFGYGLGLHLIHGEPVARPTVIDPRGDHLSFQVREVGVFLFFVFAQDECGAWRPGAAALSYPRRPHGRPGVG